LRPAVACHLTTFAAITVTFTIKTQEDAFAGPKFAAQMKYSTVMNAYASASQIFAHKASTGANKSARASV